MQKKKEFLSCYMSYLPSKLILCLKNCVKNEVQTNRKIAAWKMQSLEMTLALVGLVPYFMLSPHSDSKEGHFLLNPIKCDQPHNISHNPKV
jgi:hypothetical protein